MKVVKHDGSLEDFNPSKLNRWSEWASEECEVSWSDIVLDASLLFSDGMKTSKIHDLLIEECINRKDTGHTKMAARLMVGKIYKEAFGDYSIPHLPDFYQEAVEEGWWDDLGYTEEELKYLDTVIDHTKDFTYTYASLKQFYDKYSVDVGRKVENPQMAFMGLAMASMKSEPDRLKHVEKVYNILSNQDLNLPTPTLNGLRTPLEGSPSCCVISASDDTKSLGAATYAAYEYTAARSGIGIELETRAPKEPVKGGRVVHGGKHSLYNHIKTAVNALTQVTRGGSATVTYTCLDPEVLDLLTMKQQRTADSYRIDHLDYSLAVNNLFLKKVAKNENWLLISSYYSPELHKAFYSGNPELFEEVYNQVLESKKDKGKLVKARDIMMKFVAARSDTGRNYLTFIDNINSHTPFKEDVRLSNLCQEILLPTKPYKDVFELNKEDSEGEIALCFIGAIVAGDYSDEYLEELCYYICKIIDNTIDESVYPFKSVELSAKSRRSIGVGLTNLASWMAKNGYKYNTEQGRNAIHRLMEKHTYYLHKASVRLAKEKGACAWMDKTKYNEGWLPIDTYAKEVDNFHSQDLTLDWERLRQEVKNHGVRFSVLQAHMPCESSSVFTNNTNSLYPARRKDVFKQSRKGSVYFQVPYADTHLENYQWAWDIDNKDLAKMYAIVQKFTGQGISADFYHDYTKETSVSAKSMIELVLLSSKLGMKTWYYLNFKVDKDLEQDNTTLEEPSCESCSL